MKSIRRIALRPCLVAALIALPVLVSAGPGAHGPDGEHLDAPATAVRSASVPRFEANTELFEVVGSLQGGELSILVNRFETNEPVLGAEVEVESAGVKAVAGFHADHGDYAVADEAMTALLSRPGQHALVLTVVAGDDADLLDAVLTVDASDHDAGATGGEHGPDFPSLAWWGGAFAVSALAGIAVWRRRRAAALRGTRK